MAIQIGVVKAITGTVTATTADGSVRTLKAGDRVFANELISTAADGAVEIEFADGRVMDLGRNSQAMLDSEFYDPQATATAAAEPVPDDVAAIQQALLEGEDPTQVGEATAAGAGVEGGNEGHEAVFVDYLNPAVTPTAGFDTIGVTNEYDLPEEDIIFLEEESNPPIDFDVNVTASFFEEFPFTLPSGYEPGVGGNLALFNSSGASQADIESFLNLAPGALDLVNGNATDGSAAKFTLNLMAGDEVSFTWLFDASDYIPYDDFGFITINGEVFELSDVSVVGDYGDTGLQSYTYIADADGEVTFGFGVMNLLDTALDSSILIDNITLNGEVVTDFTSGDISPLTSIGDVVVTDDYVISDDGGGNSSGSIDLDPGFIYEFQVGEAEVVSDNIHGTDVEDGTTVDFTITSLPTDADSNQVGLLLVDRDDDGSIDEVYGDGFSPLPAGGLKVAAGDSVYYYQAGVYVLDDNEEPQLQQPVPVSFNYFTTDSDGLNSDGAVVSIGFPVVPTPTVVLADVETEQVVIKEDSSESINVTATTNAGSSLTTIVISGFEPYVTADWLDLSGLEVDGASASFVGGEIVITGINSTSYNGSFTVIPEEDSDQDAGNLVAEVVAVSDLDPGLEQTDTSPTLSVITDAILDDSIDVISSGEVTGDEMVDAQTFSLGLDGSAINPFAGSGSGGQDTDGSESGTVTLTLSEALVAGASLSLNGGYGGGVIITDGGDADPTTFALTGWTDTADLAAAIDALQVTVPGGFDGSITGSIDWSFEDDETFEGGVEDDEADNNDSGSTEFTVSVAGNVGEPEVALTVNGDGYFKEDTANDITISASTADVTDELTTLVLTGLAGWAVDAADLTALEALADVDTAEFVGGTLTITFNSGVTNFNYAALTLTPPEDTDADTAVSLTANVQDQSNNSLTNSSVVNPTLVVDAILDDSIDVSAVNVNGNEMVGEQTFSLGLNGSAINPFAGSGSGGQDTDGSESGSVTLTLDTSLVAGASLGLNGGYGGSVILTDNGDDTYTLSGWTDTADLADAIDALEVTVPGGFDGSITGSIDWSFEDDETFEGGVENIEADNNDSGSTDFSVSIADSLPSNPVNDSITVEEESIPGIGGNDEADGLSYEVMGTFANNADWGVDGFGGIVDIDGETPIGGFITINDVAGNWTLVVNAATGDYTFTMLDNINSTPFGDQVEGTDNLPTFTINAQDGDGSPISFDLNVGIVDDVPVFTIVNDGGDIDDVVSLITQNPTVDMTYFGNFADWSYGADDFGSLSASSLPPGVEVDSVAVDGSQIVLNFYEGDVLVATLTLNADGQDSLDVFRREPEVEFIPVATAAAEAGGPVGSVLVDLEDAADFNILVTATKGGAADDVNASTQGWGVDNQNINTDETITFSFVDDGDNTTPFGISDFKFQVTKWTGGFNGAVAITIVYIDADTMMQSSETLQFASVEDAVVTISELTWSSYEAGDELLSVKVEHGNATSGGAFNLNGVEVGAESVTPPDDLSYEGIVIEVVDSDGDADSQEFSLAIDGDDGDGLEVEAITGTSGSESLTGTAGDDFLIGGAGDDILTGDTGVDTFVFSLIANDGNDTITDFNGAEDVLKFTDVLDSEPDGDIDLDDLNAQITSVVDNGAGNDVVVTFNNGATITFSGAGTGAISSIESLVSNPATQIDVS